MLDGF